MENRYFEHNLYFNSLKNLLNQLDLGSHLVDAFKNALMNKNEESAIQLLENIKSREDILQELLIITILSKDFKIFKHIVEKYNVDLNLIQSINPALIYNEVNPSHKENKDLYIKIECYPLIVAALAGDLDIFKYIIETGANREVAGFVTFTKNKIKGIYTNIIGAAAFGANYLILRYIRKNLKLNKGINHSSVDKYLRQKTLKMKLENTSYTPLLLCALSEQHPKNINESINELLKFENVDINATDHENNNIIHLLVRENKVEVLHSLIEKFKHLMNKVNDKGLNAFSLAQSLNLTEIRSILSKFTVNSLSNEDLIESIENKKKSKNKKKEKKNLNETDPEIKTIQNEKKETIFKNDDYSLLENTETQKYLSSFDDLTAEKSESIEIPNTFNHINLTKDADLQFIELLKGYEALKMENLELKSLLFEQNVRSLESNESSDINDILELANTQLETKCKEINELQNKDFDLENHNLEKLDKTTLKKLFNEYSQKIEEINRYLLNN